MNSFWLAAQNDTIVANNNDMIIGEIKGMNKGILKIKTGYSDSDFSIKWKEIKQLYSKTKFIISTDKGDRYEGEFRVLTSNKVFVYVINDTIASLTLKDIVHFKTYKTKFWDRVSASVALGFNFTKSNNFRQFSLRSNFLYESKNWSIQTSYNGISSNQNNTAPIERTDAALSYHYFLKHDWFPLVEINWLSNTEQDIKLRTVSKLGIGKYLARTNKLYWGLQAGISYNNERFTLNDAKTQNSLEGFIGSELNLYNVDDLSLLTKIITYPGISESGRFRFDGNVDVKYDLPLDFFIKLGFTVNYDNNSVNLNNKYDYVFQTSFGWEL
ncbi:DUF481 domain-containing protein [Polaribacter sp. IC073]|uniref:DUF481 domain-containing protein n=1 Tax=Polaribacter sp. IC073 TaxID=2508540 RepID=UPI0011BEEF1E|nr:DUF481 domain-containing protein [Polaribacter sp. IC073]TXD47205.1 DUF481 domain-containing protein [Polaribacter sp. IC073]